MDSKVIQQLKQENQELKQVIQQQQQQIQQLLQQQQQLQPRQHTTTIHTTGFLPPNT